jgi:hypothetical protein
MQKIILLSLLASFSLSMDLHAQNQISRQYDQNVKECVQGNKNVQKELGQKFAIFSWATSLQELVAEAKDNQNADVLIEIAEERKVVDALLSLSNTCQSLQKIKPQLMKMKKVYDTGVKDDITAQQSSKGYQENRTVSMTYTDVVRLKIHINSIVNILQGDESIFKIFR